MLVFIACKIGADLYYHRREHGGGAQAPAATT
jgi:hypothetical protein